MVSILVINHGSGNLVQEVAFPFPDIKNLNSETYYFPSRKFSDQPIVFQPLQQFDLIFAGHDINLNSNHYDKIQNLSVLTPGRYTHVFAYIGKDDDGFAYAVEMNVDKSQDFKLGFNGLNVTGKLYLYCLGSDYDGMPCPENSYVYGLKSYDYMQAKRLKPELKNQLLIYETQLINTMSNDLEQQYPFQIPLNVSFNTLSEKAAYLVDDGRKNGADCASYFVSLFEEVAHVCLDDVRIDASTLSSYYVNNQIGRRAIIPEQYNPVLNETVSLKNILGDLGYSLLDNTPRPSSCSGLPEVKGIPMPDLIFNSPSLVKIEEVSLTRQ